MPVLPSTSTSANIGGAAVVHVDIERAFQTGPDLPDIIRSEAGGALVKNCMGDTPAHSQGVQKAGSEGD